MSTNGAREVPYHRSCTFDGGDPHGPLCANPATWHVLHTKGNRRSPRLACGKHLSIALPGAVDSHTVGPCCGEPGARWQFGHNQGEGFCSQGGDKQRLGADLFAPDEMKGERMNTNAPMTQEQLDAIRGRLDARTPGEWEASGHEIDALAPSWGEVVSVEVDCMNYCYGGTGRGVEHAEDADLIAHAPQDLTDLLAEVERLRARLTVDDAMVERAARAFYEYPTPGMDASLRTDWDRLTKASPDVADNYRSHMTAALNAALGTREEA